MFLCQICFSYCFQPFNRKQSIAEPLIDTVDQDHIVTNCQLLKDCSIRARDSKRSAGDGSRSVDCVEKLKNSSGLFQRSVNVSWYNKGRDFAPFRGDKGIHPSIRGAVGNF